MCCRAAAAPALPAGRIAGKAEKAQKVLAKHVCVPGGERQAQRGAVTEVVSCHKTGQVPALYRIGKYALGVR